MNDKWTREVTVDHLRRVGEKAAKRLTPIEIHSICVLLSMAFGTGTIQSRIFAWYANEMRVNLGLPRIADAVAGNPTMEEKMQILRSALEKLGDDAQAELIAVLLRSPLYQSLDASTCGEEEGKPP